MEPMTLTSHRNRSLPKLVTLKEHQRRDSLSSSRTRDSGYISEPEISFSPLEFTDSEQQLPFTPLPSVSNISLNHSPTIFKTYKTLPEPSVPRPNVTSTPVALNVTGKNEPNFPKRLTSIDFDTSLGVAASYHSSSQLALQDKEIEKWIKDNHPAYDRAKERVSSITSLSSASSCDMYTCSDISDDEQDSRNLAIQSTLPKSMLRTIEVIMRRVEVNLRYAAHMLCNGGGSSTTTGSSATLSFPGNQKTSQGGTKRKLRLEPPNDDDEEDGHNKRRRGSAATIDSSEMGVKFACPFYKHDPNRYRNRRTCPGPGWPTVHRMKEHLYRAHAQQIYCPRCYTMFDADADLTNHLRSAQCHVSAPQPIEGIDRETLKALRKRSPALRLEEDKWRDVYCLLFPNVVAEDVPSPFYDSDSPTEESRRFRRELLRRIQEALVSTAHQTPGPMEQGFLRQVAHIIRRCENDLLSSFDTPSASVPSLYGRRPSNTSTTSTSSTQPVSQTGTPNLSNVPARGPPVHEDGSGMSGRWSQAGRHEPGVVSSMPVAWPTNVIDWDALFPPPPEVSICNDGFDGFSMPMWS